jgi:adenylate cyclase
VAQWIWDHREEFAEGRKVRTREITATLLFTDLQGFSRVAEMLTAEQVMVWLNELMGALAECVESNKGLLNKYMGDSIMAVFGAPVQSTTPEEFRRDAQRAVRCALSMRRTLAKLNAKWTQEGLPVIGMRVGIFTGPVIGGVLGKAFSVNESDARVEYAVIGDTVNTASRLESFDKELMDADVAADNCRILIGGPTLDLLDGLFRTRYIGAETLKGKGGKFAIHGVIGEVDAGPAAPPAAAAATPASSALA